MNRPELQQAQIRDVEFGARVKVVEPCNLYECRIGDDCFVGPFTEIQKGAVIGARTRVQSHASHMVTRLAELCGATPYFLSAQGVAKGYEKKLKIEGIGYQARMDKKSVVLTVGYANPVTMTPPDGVTVELPDPTTILIKGADKQKVGQFTAEVRKVRPPEPYKGKGIRYDNEQVRRKEGKSFAAGG